MNIFVRYAIPEAQTSKTPASSIQPPPPLPSTANHAFCTVSVDPDNILSKPMQHSFCSLLETYDDVFDPTITGYNVAAGPFEAVVNMGPVQLSQRKGRLPQTPIISWLSYSKSSTILKPKAFPTSQKILALPSNTLTLPSSSPNQLEVINWSPPLLMLEGTANHNHPCYLTSTQLCTLSLNGGTFILTDLTSVFYQIQLSKDSIKYCRVGTPFRGVGAYTRCAMGIIVGDVCQN